MFDIIVAKVQTVLLPVKEKARRHGPDSGATAESKRRFLVQIGSYLEFNDGWTITGPDGRIHVGKGTVVRFNYRHHTWSVQQPQRCAANKVEYLFTQQRNPCWLRAEKETGFSHLSFKRNFSPAFVALCLAGNALAEGQEIADKLVTALNVA